MTALLEATELKTPPQTSRSVFLPCFIAFLFVLQTVYASIYIRSTLLQKTILLPNAIRLITWTVPVLLYLYYSRQNILNYLKLRHSVLRGVVWGLAIGLTLFCATYASIYLKHGHVRISPQFTAAVLWKAVILVGFSEEVVFRGFFLPEFAKRTNFWIANLAQAALFFAIHIPGWIFLGNSFLAIIRMGASIFFMGAVLGLVWKKSGSLWGCMLIHSFNNLSFFGIA